MAKSRIFIASSGRTLALAEKLQNRLNTEFCEATLWSEDGRRNVGKTIIETLETDADAYDFAVIILAKDDVLVAETGDKHKARDNCVFEAGLFIAALGRERCFLVNSVDQANLPSDLGGVISLQFEEPEDLSDRGACDKKIVGVADTIKDRVQQLKRKGDRPLTQKELLDREKLRGPQSPDGELFEDHVVVRSVQPLELGYEPALQVRENIITNGVEYIYLLHGSDDGARKVCQLLQMVLLAPWLDRKTADRLGVRLSKMEDPAIRSNIIEDLQTISARQGLKSFFLRERPTLQYCIHNAGSDIDSVLYLKRGKYFIMWEKGRNAREFWKHEQKRACVQSDYPTAILHAAPGFDIYEEGFERALRLAIQKYFPGIADEVTELCVKGIVI